jgi:hypothetical protein
MIFIVMAALSLSIDAIRPLDRWNHSYISPGPVGSVGDCLIQTRLKQNTPDSPMRWEYGSVGRDSITKGTNLQDGMKLNIASAGGPATTIDSNWGGRDSFKISRGWIFQDIRLPDKSVIPLYGSTPGYSWNNQVATTYRANVTGEKFLPVPGGYMPPPGTILRGNAYPKSAESDPSQDIINKMETSLIEESLITPMLGVFNKSAKKGLGI